MLLLNRGMYAKGQSPRPEVLQEGTDDKWRGTAWEPVTDWRISLSAVGPSIVTMLPFLAAALVAFWGLAYYLSVGNSKIDKKDHLQALQALHQIGANGTIIVGLTLSYLIGVFAWRRWLRSLLKSTVILRKASLLSQFNFQNNKSDSIVLASFYVSFLTLIITALALLIR
jgi:hypothetical protein